MLPVVLLVLAAQPPVSLAAPGVTASGVDQPVADAAFERFATVLGQAPGLRVVTARDLQQVLGLERQKQLLGCATDNCIAEIAGSLGVDALVSATLARVGSRYVTTLRIVRSRDGVEVASASSRLADLDEVSGWLDEQADVLGRRVLVSFGRTEPPSRGPGFAPFVPGLVGLLAGGAGAGLLAASQGDRTALTNASVPVAEIPAVVERGRTLEIAGWALAGVGVAGLAASVAWLIARPAAPQPSVSFIVTPGAGMVVVQGGLP